MKLIVGLGNPGREYENTRHNLGFKAVNKFARLHRLDFQLKDRFKGETAELAVGEYKVILLKPHTFYNLVGDSIRAAKDFYKVGNEDILVVHDELALPFGTIRTRPGKSDAGNNGVRHIIQTVGPYTTRIRVGIHNDLADKIEATNFVLGKFTEIEKTKLDEVLSEVIALMNLFARGQMPHVTYKLGNDKS